MSVQYALTNNTFETEAGVVSIPVDDTASSFGRAYSSGKTEQLLALKEDLTNKDATIPATPTASHYPSTLAVKAYVDGLSQFLDAINATGTGSANLSYDIDSNLVMQFVESTNNGYAFKLSNDGAIGVAPITAGSIGTYVNYGTNLFAVKQFGTCLIENDGTKAGIVNGQFKVETYVDHIELNSSTYSIKIDNSGKITRAPIAGGVIGTYGAYLSHPDYSTLIDSTTDTSYTVLQDGYVIMRQLSSPGVNVSIGSVQIIAFNSGDFVSPVIPVSAGDVLTATQTITFEFYLGK